MQGTRHLLGLWEGATENATVCRELLSDWPWGALSIPIRRSGRAREATGTSRTTTYWHVQHLSGRFQGDLLSSRETARRCQTPAVDDHCSGTQSPYLSNLAETTQPFDAFLLSGKPCYTVGASRRFSESYPAMVSAATLRVRRL
jgi:hypothetical protein